MPACLFLGGACPAQGWGCGEGSRVGPSLNVLSWALLSCPCLPLAAVVRGCSPALLPGSRPSPTLGPPKPKGSSGSRFGLACWAGALGLVSALMTTSWGCPLLSPHPLCPPHLEPSSAAQAAWPVPGVLQRGYDPGSQRVPGLPAVWASVEAGHPGTLRGLFQLVQWASRRPGGVWQWCVLALDLTTMPGAHPAWCLPSLLGAGEEGQLGLCCGTGHPCREWDPSPHRMPLKPGAEWSLGGGTPVGR